MILWLQVLDGYLHCHLTSRKCWESYWHEARGTFRYVPLLFAWYIQLLCLPNHNYPDQYETPNSSFHIRLALLSGGWRSIQKALLVICLSTCTNICCTSLLIPCSCFCVFSYTKLPVPFHTIYQNIYSSWNLNNYLPVCSGELVHWSSQSKRQQSFCSLQLNDSFSFLL